MKWFFVFRTCWARLKEEAVSLLGWYSPRGVRISQSLAGWQAELARSLEQNKALGETFSCSIASIPNYSGSSLGDFKNGEVIGLECIWFLQRKLRESHGLENCRGCRLSHFPCPINRDCQGGELAALGPELDRPFVFIRPSLS